VAVAHPFAAGCCGPGAPLIRTCPAHSPRSPNIWPRPKLTAGMRHKRLRHHRCRTTCWCHAPRRAHGCCISGSKFGREVFTAHRLRYLVEACTVMVSACRPAVQAPAPQVEPNPAAPPPARGSTRRRPADQLGVKTDVTLPPADKTDPSYAALAADHARARAWNGGIDGELDDVLSLSLIQ
jgi:hypothetical protein